MWQRCKAERGVRSEKMLMALEQGVKGSRFIQPKSVKKFKSAVKPLTKRANERSLEAIARELRPRLQGFYGYFKHAERGSLAAMDGWIRARLRGILRKRMGLRGRGRGRDHQRWNNRYFANLGLFSLAAARDSEIISLH